MGQARKAERRPGKSDEIDALAVARAVLREGIERFPAAFLDERAMEIRLLADHRNDLIAERTRIVNRLLWHLVDLCPTLEAQVPARCLDHPVWLEKIARKLQRLPVSQARVQIARQLAASIRQLTRQANDPRSAGDVALPVSLFVQPVTPQQDTSKWNGAGVAAPAPS